MGSILQRKRRSVHPKRSVGIGNWMETYAYVAGNPVTAVDYLSLVDKIETPNGGQATAFFTDKNNPHQQNCHGYALG